MNHYPLEKLVQTINCLATGPGRIKERLVSAITSQYMFIEETALPSQIRSDFNMIQTLLEHGEKLNEQEDSDSGSIAKMVNGLSEEEASEIAQRMLKMEDDLRTAWAETKG